MHIRKFMLLALCAALTMSAAGSADEVPAAPIAEQVPAVVLSTDIADYKLPVAEAPFGLQEREAVESSYFDDAVFIGDSISLKLHYYVKAQRQKDKNFMGKAQFLVAGSLGSGNALWDVSAESVHPSYKGTKRLIEDSVAAMGVKKIYIMLGINDVSMYGIDGSVENMRTLIRRILAKSPEAEIFVQSATPRIAAMKSKPTNQMLFEYDLKLYELCVSEGWHFVDVASVMRDQKGNLPDSYCSDAPTMGMHFTDEACQVWVDYLMTHTPEPQEVEVEPTEVPADDEEQDEPVVADSSTLSAVMGALSVDYGFGEGMLDLTEDDLMGLYGIAAEDVKQFAAKLTMDSICADEVILIEAVDAQAAKRVKEQLDARYQAKLNETRNYLPAEFEKIEKCKVEVHGSFISLIVLENAAEAAAAFAEAIK